MRDHGKDQVEKLLQTTCRVDRDMPEDSKYNVICDYCVDLWKINENHCNISVLSEGVGNSKHIILNHKEQGVYMFVREH